jgi:hypothetical protein
VILVYEKANCSKFKSRTVSKYKDSAGDLLDIGTEQGVTYKTAYMMFEVKLKAHCQPRSAALVKAVVEQYKKTPVRIVERASVPLRPSAFSSTRNPPRRAPGTPSTAMISEFR